MVGAFLVQYLQFCAVALCRNGFRATSMHDILIELRLSVGSVWRYLPGSVGDSPSSVIQSMAATADSVGGFTRQGRGASLTGIVVAAIKARRTLDEQTRCVRAGSSGVVRGCARPGPGHGVERCRLPSSATGHQRMCGARIRMSAPVDADAVAGVIPAIIPGLLMQRAWLGAGLTDQFEARGVRAGVRKPGPGTSPLVTTSLWGRRRLAGTECRRGDETELSRGRTGGAVARVSTEMLEMCFETGGPPDGVPVFLVMAGHALVAGPIHFVTREVQRSRRGSVSSSGEWYLGGAARADPRGVAVLEHPLRSLSS